MNGVEYQYAFIRDCPIVAKCPRCKRVEKINAPTLENVCCFWCGPRLSRLRPVDESAYNSRLANLWRYTVKPQLELSL